MNSRKIKNKPSPGKRFWMLLKPDKKEITALYVYAIFNGLIYLALPLGVQSIVNFIQGGQISTSWIILVSLVLTAIFLSGYLSIYQLRITENIEQKIFSRAAFEFAYRLPRLTETVKKKFYLPELANRFFETIALQKGITKILMDFSAAVVQIIFGIIVLSFYHSAFILFIAISFAFIYFLFRLTVKRGLDTSLEESKHKYKLVFWLQEIGRNSTTFRSAGFPDLPLKKTNQHAENYIDAREQHFQVLRNQYWLLVLFKVLIIGSLLIIGGVLVIEQKMNIGQFVAAEIIILLMMSSVEKLILNMRTIYDVLTALEKIGYVTDMNLEKIPGSMNIELSDKKGIEIKLENFTVGKETDSRKIISNQLNLTVEAGSKIVLTGKDEDKRDELFNILSGNSNNYLGLMKFCGLSVRTISFEQLQSRIGIYSGDETIFTGTVLENITLGREGLKLKDVISAARAVYLDSVIQSLSNGYETLLSVNGHELSVTVRKKIILARALVHRPKLLAVNIDLLPEDEMLRNKLIKMLTSLTDCTLVATTTDNNLISGEKIILNTDNGIIELTQ